MEEVAEGGKLLVVATADARKPKGSSLGCVVSLKSDCSDGEVETHGRRPKP